MAVARSPDALVNDIASAVGITARATLTILDDLEDAGYLIRERIGRRNHYDVSRHRPFRHPATADREVDALLSIFDGDPQEAGRQAP